MRVKHFIGIAIGMLLIVVLTSPDILAQCAICGKVAAAQNEKAASSFNAGILYLMAIPFSVVGFIGYRWYKTNFAEEEE